MIVSEAKFMKINNFQVDIRIAGQESLDDLVEKSKLFDIIVLHIDFHHDFPLIEVVVDYRMGDEKLPQLSVQFMVFLKIEQ